MVFDGIEVNRGVKESLCVRARGIELYMYYNI